jgi:hypothetical protein
MSEIRISKYENIDKRSPAPQRKFRNSSSAAQKLCGIRQECPRGSVENPCSIILESPKAGVWLSLDNPAALALAAVWPRVFCPRVDCCDCLAPHNGLWREGSSRPPGRDGAPQPTPPGFVASGLVLVVVCTGPQRRCPSPSPPHWPPDPICCASTRSLWGMPRSRISPPTRPAPGRSPPRNSDPRPTETSPLRDRSRR